MNWYKISQNATIPIISFDFDSTIVKYEWDGEEGDFKKDALGEYIYTLNEPIVNLIKEAKGKGNRVYIVSSRLEANKSDIEDVVSKYGLVVDGIYCTNGQNKVETLKRLGVKRHYDDDPNEIRLINQGDTGIEGIQV